MDTNKKKLNIALFGGSFDPPQSAHAEIIEALSKEFDKVIVMPAYISPFKTGAGAAEPEHRLNMLKICTAGIKNAEVSDYELKSGGVSYTYKTAEHLKKTCGGCRISVVTGTDLVGGLSEWKNIESLFKNIEFYIIKRAGYPIKKRDLQKLENAGAKITLSKLRFKKASSTLCRLHLAFYAKKNLPDGVYSYILAHGLYAKYKEYVSGLYYFGLSGERIKHVLRSAEQGIRLSERHNLDASKAVTALLLHDIGKSASKVFLENSGVSVPAQVFSLPEKIVHQSVSALIAEQYYGITDEDILNAVRYHTTGRENMSELEMVVYLADYTESGRKFDGVKDIRRAAKRSLEEGLAAALGNCIENLEAAGKEIYPLTRKAYEFYNKFADENKTKKDDGMSIKDESIKKASLAEKAVKGAKPAGKKTAAAAKPQEEKPGLALARQIAGYLDDKKARDITLIDLSGKTIIADYFVIATGTSSTAVRALTDYVDEKLSKEHATEPLRRDIDTKWAAIDYGSVILHIQTAEVRDFYNIERLWSDGDNVASFKKN